MKDIVGTTLKLKVELSELDGITANTLSFFLKSKMCEIAELNETSSKPNVLVIDNEIGIKENVLEGLKANNQYAILLHMVSNKPEVRERLFCIQKPIQVFTLKEAFKKIHKALHSNQINNTLSDGGLIADSEPEKAIEKGFPSKGKRNLQDVESNELEFASINENEVAEAVNELDSESNELYERAIKVQELVNEEISQIPPVKKKKPSKNAHLGMAVQNETNQEKQNRYKAHKHVGSNKDINPNNPDELEIIFHTPEKYLYYHLANAMKLGKEQNKDIRIETIFGNIYLENKAQIFHYKYDDKKLKYAQKSPLFLDVKCISVDLSKRIISDNKLKQDAQILVWNSSIAASKGRIPNGSSLNSVVFMKSWPNFTKLMIFRYAVQITSAWSRNNLSLLATAKQLQIPQRYVFTLYNAMHAIGCASISEDLTIDSGIRGKSKSVFSKILSHIFK